MATNDAGTPTATIVKELFDDLTKLMQGELALVKDELRENAAKLGSGAGMFGGAAALGFFAGHFVLLAIMFGLIRLGVPPWGAALLVAIGAGAGAALLGLGGKKKVSNAHLAPTESAAQVRRDVNAIKSDVSRLRGE